MAKKKKKSVAKESAGNRFTPLAAHTRRGTRLRGPLSALNMQVLHWDRDLLPEYLWVASLESSRAGAQWPELYNRFMDALDAVVIERSALLGLITDFGAVPEERRADFLRSHRDLVNEAFHEPFGRILAFYPDSPAYWLVQQDRLEAGASLDPNVELPLLRHLILKLMPGKDLIAGHIRAVPLNRLFKHNQIVIHDRIMVTKLLPKYPVYCTEDEKYRVQQFARMVTNIRYQQDARYTDRGWSKYFWRHNFDLVPCSPRDVAISMGRQVDESSAIAIYEALRSNSTLAIGYLRTLSARMRCDLYDSDRDEILFGLFSRMTRLYVLIAHDPNLWARDIAGIMLRCLTDTAITFVYLASRGSQEDFAAFRKYGEGKEKLLMLHLQDNYPLSESLEGRTPTEIGEDLGGGFSPELVDIDLANWTKKSARDLAREAGLEEFYRLVYDPTSSDVHGTWVSLKNSNLVRCAEPIHRFHRLPAYTEPPLYVNSIIAAQDLYKKCVETAQRVLDCPAMSTPLVEIPRRNG